MCPYTDGAKGNPEDTSYYDEEFGISILTPILESVPLIRKPEFAKVCGHKLPDYDIEGLISNARSGHRGSRFVLGCKYYNGTDVKQSYEDAMKWFIKASNKQDPKAAFYLGCMYLSGIGTEQSYENAANWFRKAVSFGDPDAMFDLGRMYETGEYFDQSYEEAFEWYSKAAELNHPRAQCNLGNLYYFGKGVECSVETALKLYIKSANRDLREGRNNFAVMYEKGVGIAYSPASAARLYKRAIDQSDCVAKYNLGCMHYKGSGMPRSLSKAKVCFWESAKEGNLYALYALDRIYRMHGREVWMPELNVSVPEILEKMLKTDPDMAKNDPKRLAYMLKDIFGAKGSAVFSVLLDNEPEAFDGLMHCEDGEKRFGELAREYSMDPEPVMENFRMIKEMYDRIDNA